MAAKDTEKTLTLTESQLEELVMRLTDKRMAEHQEEKKQEQSELDRAIEAWWDEPVPLRLFRDGRDYKADVFVSANNYRAQIKRGIEVMVPRRIARVIEEALDQSNIASDRLREAAEYIAGF